MQQTSFIFDKIGFLVETTRSLLQFQPPPSMRKRPRVESPEEQIKPKRSKMDGNSYTTIIRYDCGGEDLPVGTAEVCFFLFNSFFLILIFFCCFFLDVFRINSK